MELFTSAGIELPTTEAAKTRRGRALAKALRAPLFNRKVVQDAARVAKLFELTDAKRALAADYARKIKDPSFLKQKEVAVRGRLIEEVLQGLLGYRPYDPDGFDLAIERPIGSGAVDVALGRFNTPDSIDEIVAPFELKGPDSFDLDRVMPGRGRSPVQQAWDYAIDAPGSRWVLVSNCLEIRLYGFGRGRNAYELFDLTRLDEPLEQDRLWLILGAANLLGGATDKLLRDTDTAYRDITNELYIEYRTLRDNLVNYLSQGDHAVPPLKAIEIAQKLLDRIIFIAFAQRTDLMEDRLLERAAATENSFAPQPLWQNFLGLFKAVDKGSDRLGIPEYNGGLFANDPLADSIMLPDHLAREIASLGKWDYRSDVPVTVLGHLFEQSITDIEALKAGSPPVVSKRKREGVVYTPDMITRFLVERTVALSLEERRDALWLAHGMENEPSPETQTAFWRAYLAVLSGFTIVDPACGSGAFLVAAFDEMARRYRDAVTALEELGADIDFDVFDRIVTYNLHGVDLNAESVEITRLALWLKTARREHRLQNLETTIKDGNSLIAEAWPGVANPFDWKAAFPDVFARGGFDVVIGNPPYVRMEHLKEIKPYLAQHYVVADDRTDLYAYFFEKGVEVLKLGGRLGYISSSTFFKTGSGEKLRIFLSDGLAIEAVVDFGDVQVFEGVTTYPAILTLRKGEAADAGDLSFLSIKDKAPEDLARAFQLGGQTMPRVRLGKGSWQLEGDALAALRAKITAGKKTLGEVYGAPMRGIVTGLNKAFVLRRETRDALIKADPKSADLLKSFLRGENIKRWRVESEDLFLINTPKGKVDIEAYPAVKAHLIPFREELEKRATKQEWWELQQAQLAFQPAMLESKIIYPEMSQGPKFVVDQNGDLLSNKCFFVPLDWELAAYLNSRVCWFWLFGTASPLRGGQWRLELREQYVAEVPVPTDEIHASGLTSASQAATKAACDRFALQTAVRRRVLDFAPPERRKLNGKLEAWYDLDFAAFRAEIKKVFGADIPLKERGEWEAYLAENAAEVHALTARIEAAEREIDAIVYRLFDLTPDEIALLEASLEGQY
jgi:hypothetical protein